MTPWTGWYKIAYNGSTGYVSADYLNVDQDNVFTTYGRVNSDGVNVRSDASTDSSVLATIEEDAIVTVNGLGKRLVRRHLRVRHGGLHPQRLPGSDRQSPPAASGSAIVETANAASGHPLCLRRRFPRRL